MFARIKSTMFIDTLRLELNDHSPACVKAVLKDDSGSVCRFIEQSPTRDQLTWEGLNELPYGIYTLELSRGAEDMKMQVVKRI